MCVKLVLRGHAPQEGTLDANDAAASWAVEAKEEAIERAGEDLSYQLMEHQSSPLPSATPCVTCRGADMM